MKFTKVVKAGNGFIVAGNGPLGIVYATGLKNKNGTWSNNDADAKIFKSLDMARNIKTYLNKDFEDFDWYIFDSGLLSAKSGRYSDYLVE